MCTNVKQLASWSNQRLAMLTIAVPVEETAVSGVTPEVAAGAGGVLLFGSSAPPNLAEQLSILSSHAPGHRGMLIMTDEEGGGVQRMANLVGNLPWPAFMGTHWTPSEVSQQVGAVAKRMAAVGVNMDLAPVVDVDGTDAPPNSSNPDGWRSFSGSTSVVTRDGLAFARGLLSNGVITVVKHFPGLGGSHGNSDLGPAETLPWATLQREAIPPFADAIRVGVPAVMVSNDTVPGLTSVPASLSLNAISHELDGSLHFHGLIMTDSLTAGAISAAGYTAPNAAVQALRAGADMVIFSLVPNVASLTSQMESAIVGAVADGILPRGRLVEAADHVLAVRHVNLCRP
jgi:beta-N-acetylhexosaminidase